MFHMIRKICSYSVILQGEKMGYLDAVFSNHLKRLIVLLQIFLQCFI